MPRMPKSATSTPSGSVAPGEPARHLDAEPVVAEEDVADAGDQDAVCAHGPAAARPRRAGSSGSGPCATWRSARRVAVDGDGEVHRRRRRRAAPPAPSPGRPCEEQVLGVGRRGAGPQQHPAALARPACRRRARVGLGIDRGVGAGIPPRHVRREHARPVDRVRSAGAAGGRRAAYRIAPCRRSQHLAAASRRPRRSPRPRAVGRPGLRLLLVGERQRAQAEDLVDLGAVEQVAGLSGASCGWSSRMIGEDSSTSARPVVPGEHRPGVLVVQRARPPAGPTRGGSVTERNAPAVEAEQQVRGDQRVPQRGLARRRRRGRSESLSTSIAQPQHVVRARAAARPPTDEPARSAAGSAAAHAAADDGARRSSLRRGRRTARVIRVTGPATRDGRRRPFLGTPSSHGTVPVVAVDELVDGPKPSPRRGRTARAAAGTAVDGEAAPGAGSSRHSVRERSGSPRREPGRDEHAELPAQPVLRRRGAVGVEQVALEEDGVGDAAGLGERGRRSSVTAPRSRRLLQQPLHRRRPRSAAPGRSGSARSASRVVPAQPEPAGAREVRVHHLPPHRDRQPERRLPVPRHQPDLEARRAPVKTCRRTAAAAGPRPPSRPRKYLVAAMSRS